MRFEHYETLGSTSSRARQLAQDGDFGPVWIQADQQTEGRGRLGRSWVSPQGNLYCTGLYPVFSDPGKTALLGFAAALAVIDLVKLYSPDCPTRIKWPNDIRIDGQKLAGILLESGEGPGGRRYISIGVGVNLLRAPDITDYPTTCLAAHMDIIDPEQVPNARSACAALAHYFNLRRDVLIEQGFAPLRKDWLAHAEGLGKEIQARYEGEIVTGRFEDLSADGALLLRLPERGTVRISSGEIVLGT